MVLSIFHFHPYPGKWSNLTSIFFRCIETTSYSASFWHCCDSQHSKKVIVPITNSWKTTWTTWYFRLNFDKTHLHGHPGTVDFHVRVQKAQRWSMGEAGKQGGKTGGLNSDGFFLPLKHIPLRWSKWSRNSLSPFWDGYTSIIIPVSKWSMVSKSPK